MNIPELKPKCPQCPMAILLDPALKAAALNGQATLASNQLLNYLGVNSIPPWIGRDVRTLQELGWNVQTKPEMTGVIVSNTDNVDRFCENSDYADSFANLFASDAGGTLWLRGDGKYSSRKGIIPETVHLVVAFYDSAEARIEGLYKLSPLMRQMQRERGQECIGMLSNWKLHLLS